MSVLVHRVALRRPATPAVAAGVFLVSLGVNVLSASPGLVPVRAPDTVGYLDVARQMLRGELPYLHLRTPGYPLFLWIAELTGSWHHIVWIQAIMGAVAAVALWGILLACIRSPVWAGVAAVGLISPYDVSSWHGIALTESLSISLVILWAYVHLAQLGALPVIPLSRRALPWVAVVFDVLLVMQRPTFFFLPVLWYSALLTYRFTFGRDASADKPGLPAARSASINLALAALVILGWCGMIWMRYGRFEITLISRFNRLGNLMSLRFASTDACSRRLCSALVRRGVELASTDSMRVQGPYPVIAQLEAEFPDVPRGAMLDSLNRVLAPENRLLIPLRALRRAEFILGQRGLYNSNGVLFRAWPYRIYSSLAWRLSQKTSDVAVLWGALYVVLVYRLARRLDWVRVVLVFIVTYTAGVSILAGYEGWDRLIAPVVVPLNVLILLLALDLARGTAARFQTSEKAVARSSVTHDEG